MPHHQDIGGGERPHPVAGRDHPRKQDSERVWGGCGALSSAVAKIAKSGTPRNNDFSDPGLAKTEGMGFPGPTSLIGEVDARERIGRGFPPIIPGLVTREGVEEAREDWGEDSPLWTMRILATLA